DRVAQTVRESAQGGAEVRASKSTRLGAMAAAGVLVGLLAWWVNRGEGPQEGATRVARETGPAAVPAEMPGGAEDRTSPDSAGGASAMPVPAQGHVVGRLTDRTTGAPIAGATVRLRKYWRSATTDPVPDVAMSGVTDAEGRYRLDIGPDFWQLEVFSADHVGTYGETFINDISRMQDPEIDGPIAVSPDAAPDPDFPPEDALRIALRAGETVTRDFRLRLAASLTGEIVDAAGRPVAGATVDFTHELPFRNGRGPIRIGGSAYSNNTEPGVMPASDSGRFRLSGLWPAGRILLEVRRGATAGEPAAPVKHPGDPPGRMSEVDLLPGRNNVRIVLPERIVLSGDVLDTADRPVAGALVFVSRPDLRQAFATRGELDGCDVLAPEGALSDANGRFLFRREGDPPRSAAAWAPGHGWTMVDVNPASCANLRLRIPEADDSLRGQVLDEADNPLPGAIVVVEALERRESGKRSQFRFKGCVLPLNFQPGDAVVFAHADGPHTAAGADGGFELKDLPLGAGESVVFRVRADGFHWRTFRADDGTWRKVVLKK
ncbi:MAG: hypothetical protein FD180_5187, partial [Planctomycetota bacterium]